MISDTSLKRKIRLIFVSSKCQTFQLSEILKEIDLLPKISAKRKYSPDSLIKTYIFMVIKGIKSQRKLIVYLNGHLEDSVNLGFDKDVDRLILPTRRDFSHFISTLSPEILELANQVITIIKEFSDKFNIVFDDIPLEKKPKTPCTEKTTLQSKNSKEKELLKLVKDKLRQRLSFSIKQNSVFKDNDFLDLLINIAATQNFAEGGSKIMAETLSKRVPSADTLFYHLKKFDYGEVQRIFYDLFDTIFKMAKKGGLILDRKLDLAIDATPWFFYGNPEHPAIIGTKPERGTKWCFKFITIDIINHGQRFTLFALPYLPQDDQTDLVERLVSFAKERIRIGTILLDRGFLGSECIRRLNKLDVKFIMPMKESNNAMKNSKTKATPFIQRDAVMGDCKFNLVVIEGDRGKQGFATNIDIGPRDVLFAQKIADMYRRRWQIETGYRVKKYNFRGKTTSINYVIRYFYFMLSVILYNCWILVDLLIMTFLGIRTTKTMITARMFSTRLLKSKYPDS